MEDVWKSPDLVYKAGLRMVHDHRAWWERGECGRGRGQEREGKDRRRRGPGRKGGKLFSHFHYEPRSQILKILTTVLIMELHIMDRNKKINKFGIFFANKFKIFGKWDILTLWCIHIIDKKPLNGICYYPYCALKHNDLLLEKCKLKTSMYIRRSQCC